MYFCLPFDKIKSMETDIRYLLKFVSKDDYAQSIIEGKLYMRTANYYRTIFESESKDPYEGSVSHKSMIFKGSNHYIFSTYQLTNKMINENATINIDLVKHFGCQEGFIVLLDFKKFSNLLKNSSNNSYELIGFSITYCNNINMKMTKTMLLGNHYESLAIKPTKFKDENEYRFVSGNASDDDTIPYILDMGFSLKNCSKVFSVRELFKNKNSISMKELLLAI